MKLLISIVLYNKSIGSISFLKQLIKQDNFDLFIYDNSPTAQPIPKVDGFNIYYQHDKNNSGVSRAYNQAYKKAKDLNKELLLVLDQDSDFKLDFIEQYIKIYKIYGNSFLYAPIVCDENKSKIYSPAFLNNFVGKIQKIDEFKYSEKYSLIGKSAINSGLMISLKLFEKIGGYNEKLKLDFSDIYFIEKYKELNEYIILIDVYLKHSISGDEGKDYNKELNRFKYYCSASNEIGKSLNTTIIWSPFRRLLRLILKYKKLHFMKIFYNYYIKGKQI